MSFKIESFHTQIFRIGYLFLQNDLKITRTGQNRMIFRLRTVTESNILRTDVHWK